MFILNNKYLVCLVEVTLNFFQENLVDKPMLSRFFPGQTGKKYRGKCFTSKKICPLEENVSRLPNATGSKLNTYVSINVKKLHQKAK